MTYYESLLTGTQFRRHCNVLRYMDTHINGAWFTFTAQGHSHAAFTRKLMSYITGLARTRILRT